MPFSSGNVLWRSSFRRLKSGAMITSYMPIILPLSFQSVRLVIPVILPVRYSCVGDSTTVSATSGLASEARLMATGKSRTFDLPEINSSFWMSRCSTVPVAGSCA